MQNYLIFQLKKKLFNSFSWFSVILLGLCMRASASAAGVLNISGVIDT